MKQLSKTRLLMIISKTDTYIVQEDEKKDINTATRGISRWYYQSKRFFPVIMAPR